LCMPFNHIRRASMAILERYTLSKSKEFQNLAKNPGIVALTPIINPVTFILSSCQLLQFERIQHVLNVACSTDLTR
ncbi:hypothetical protein L9F63_024290, partial [Diploptera punctata]